MSRVVWLVIGLAIGLPGCGTSTPPASSPEPTVELGESSATPDPTPVLPIPDNVPGAEADSAAKVPINPIPDDQLPAQPDPK
jgi:hypothetical protein